MLRKYILVLSLILLSHSHGWAGPFEISKSEQVWLDNHPEISVGILDNSPPQSMVGKNGKVEGVDPEVVKLLNKKLAGRLKIVSGPWNEIYNAAKEKRLDVLMCLTPSEARLKYFNYTRPYMAEPHVIIAKKKGPDFGNIASLNGHTVALARGNFLVSYIREHYPAIKIKEYADPVEALKAVHNEEAKAHIGSRIVAEYLMDKNSIHDLKIHSLSQETSETNVIAVRKDWPVLASLLDRALASIPHNELHGVMNSWDKAHAKNKTIQSIDLTDEEKIWVQNHPNIVVGAETDWPPYDFVANGEATGFKNDYIRLLAEKVGLNLQFVHGFTWTELLDKLEKKEIDLIPALSKTPERQKFANYTTAYFNIKESLIVHRNAERIHSLDDMAGKSLARLEGYSSNKILMKKYPEIEIVFVTTAADGLIAVSEGLVDGYMDDLGVINYLRRKYLIEDLRVADANSLPSEAPAFHIGVRLDWKVLSGILEKAMSSVTLNEYNNLKNLWLVTEEMKINEFQLDPAEKAWLGSLGTLRVGICTSWAPFDFAGEDGTHKGITSEYVKIIKNKLGLKLEIIFGQWHDIQSQARAGEIDILPILNDTKTRREFLSFTKPYLHIPMIIATRTDSPYFPHIHDLTNIVVGVGEGYAIQEKLSRDYPEVTTRGYRTIKEALVALDSGEVSALVVNSSVFSYFQKQLGLQTTTYINNTTPYEDVLAMGVRHDLSPLVPLLNRVLAGISPEEHELISDKWVNLSIHKQTDWKMVWRITAGSIVLLFIVLFWNVKMTREVNRRRKAEANLIESEDQFRHTFEQAAVGIAHVAIDGRFIQINQKFCDILGYLHKEMMERTFQEITHPDDLEVSLEYVYQILVGEISSYVMEKRYIKKDGSDVWVNITVSLACDQSGKPKYFISVVKDITERKKLQKERDRILNLSYDLIAIAGMDGYFKYVNPAWEKILGYTKEELLSRPFLDFIHPDDHVKNDAEVENLSTGKETFDFENRYIAEDGAIHTISWTATSLVSEGLIYCIGRDITERKLVAFKLEKQQQLLDETGRIARVGGWEFDAQTLDLSWTQEIYRIHEVEDDFLPTVEGAMDFYLPESKRQLQSAVDNAIGSGDPYDLELELLTAKGNLRWVRAIGHVNISGGVIKSVLGTYQDISARKKAEEEKEKLEYRLREAQKKEAIGTMAGGFAHNFNNLLYIVLGNAEIAKEGMPEGSDAYDCLEEILDSTNRAMTLVQQIMTVSNQDSSIKEKFKPEKLLRKAINSLKALIPENVEVDANISSGVGEIRIEPSDFKKVVTNICMNAFDAMQGGYGVLGISLENIEPGSEKLLGEFGLEPGDFVRITISDTGHGITTENMTRIFNPFFTTKEVGQGEGIGLSEAQGIVTKCGGKIHVESDVDRGSIFSILLPLIPPEV